jgi:pimeloyl-ACP methyl ester carboxylesterase
MTTPTVVLVHGAFADSSSWNAVIAHLRSQMVPVVAAANPLRSVTGDAAYVRDVLTTIEGPIVLVGHSYGGIVATEAAAGNPNVRGLVYVGAFAPDTGENAFDLSGKFPGSTLGDTLSAYPLASGETELVIRQELFPQQFAADVDKDLAALMAATQRPVTQTALTEGLPTGTPAWKDRPSWSVFGSDDRNIPAELLRFMAERAGARSTVEIPGASHALAVSRPVEVGDVILAAVQG